MTLYKNVKIYHLEGRNIYFCLLCRNYYDNISLEYIKDTIDLISGYTKLI